MQLISKNTSVNQYKNHGSEAAINAVPVIAKLDDEELTLSIHVTVRGNSDKDNLLKFAKGIVREEFWE